jgi:hypothetical protein
MSRLSAVAFAAFALLVLAMPSQALTMKECGARYQDAQKAGTLGGATWNEFRKSSCADEAPAAAATTTPASMGAEASAAAPSATATSTPAATPETATPKAAPAASGPAVFPAAVSPSHAGETPRSARFKTCIEQYRSNKATGGNGGLKWVQKGGGYYSECNRRLKG